MNINLISTSFAIIIRGNKKTSWKIQIILLDIWIRIDKKIEEGMNFIYKTWRSCKFEFVLAMLEDPMYKAYYKALDYHFAEYQILIKGSNIEVGLKVVTNIEATMFVNS